METEMETETETDTPTATEEEEMMQAEFDGWPYGYNEALQQEAVQVMEDAGYGPDNQFELQWTQYTSDTWRQMAQTIRDRLSAAHIDMSIEQADFSSLINRGRNGELEAFTLGWIADYPAPDNFLQLIDPPNTDYNQTPTPSGAYVFWTEDNAATQAAESAFDTVDDNPAPTGSAQDARNEAYIQMEEAMWGGIPMIPMFHETDEPMWYDRVSNYPVHGSMGRSRQKQNNTQIQGRDELRLLQTGTASTFDPIKSTDTASGEMVSNVFDALTNYPNGEAAVENLLAEDFEVSDDFTTYTFQLKDNVTFHDGSDFTADDMVYSWRRLAESDNSRRTGFLLDFLGVTVERDDEDNVVPDSLGVEAVDDTTFRVELESPFASALSMVAYSSFAAVPEGIVGDIEGYDGEVSYSEFATQNPIGCGPFEFENWDQGSEYSVTAYDDYHGSTADVNRVVWPIIEDDTASYNAFMNENVDIGGIPTSQYSQDNVNIEETDSLGRGLGTYGPVRNGKTLNLAQVPTVSTFYIGFNTQAVPLPVRKAMAYVVNQQQFANQVFKGRVQPGYHLTPPLIFPGGGNAYTRHANPDQSI
jgi:peptide/nickel transport system substrate-binding protein